MRKTVVLLTMLVCAFAGHNKASAYTACIDGNYYDIIFSSGAVFSYNAFKPYTGEVNIPASVEYKGTVYDVVEIDMDGFYLFGEDITAVNVDPDSKAASSDNGFLYSKDKKEILFIPPHHKGMLTIGADVGMSNYVAGLRNSLSAFTVADGNPYFSVDNGVLYSSDGSVLLRCPGCFEGGYTIPEGTCSIADYAFAYCEKLESVAWPAGVSEIGEAAFSFCTSLTSMSLPEGIKNISGGLFECCDNLVEVDLPESVTTICSFAFNCSALTCIRVPAGVEHIENSAFSGAESLVMIDVAEGNMAYKSHDGALLTRDGRIMMVCPEGKRGIFVIPEGVEEADDFTGCQYLEEVVMPASLRSVNSFMYCSSLKTIRSFVTEPFPINYSTFYHTMIDTGKMVLYVPAGSGGKYGASRIWDFFDIREFDTSAGMSDAVLSKDVTELARYSADGRRLDRPVKGMNIVRMSDGSIRKVLVR